MSYVVSRPFPFLLIFAGIVTVGLSGCPSGQSPDAAVDTALKNAGMTRDKVYPLAGKITIDGQTPTREKPGDVLIVMLNDPKKMDVPPMARPKAMADAEGKFSFTTYSKDDGVKEGKYVITIAILHRRGKKGYLGPDGLKNRFNDPDKNANSPEFAIDHKAPGKSNYEFNLEMAGKEPGVAGPNSLTAITDKGMK